MRIALVSFALLWAAAPAVACKMPANLPAIQAQIAQSWNAERAAKGLSKLKTSAKLDKVAQKLACDNADRAGFFHIGSDGADLGKRLKRAGYRFATANENVGKFRAAEGAVSWWMGSAGHRANILSPKVAELGIGLAVGDDGRFYPVGISAASR